MSATDCPAKSPASFALYTAKVSEHEDGSVPRFVGAVPSTANEVAFSVVRRMLTASFVSSGELMWSVLAYRQTHHLHEHLEAMKGGGVENNRWNNNGDNDVPSLLL